MDRPHQLSWGVITILTAYVRNAPEFYLARLLLGTAEASFFPGIIIYLTRWFTAKDRARAIAAFYAASPIAAFVGSAVAGWLLPIYWMGLSGWRWLFIVEGLPAMVLGAITLFYLTDYPAEAGWLSEGERAAIASALAGESAARAKHGRVGFRDAWKDSRLLLLVTGYFLYILAVVSNTLWMPTFLQRLSNLPPATVARFVMLPAAAGVAGLLLNSWSADSSGEHKWHAVIPMLLLSGDRCRCWTFRRRIGAVYALLPVLHLCISQYLGHAHHVPVRNHRRCRLWPD